MSVTGFMDRFVRDLPVVFVQVGLVAGLGSCSDGGSDRQGGSTAGLQAGDYHHTQWELATANLRLDVSGQAFNLVVYGCDYVENEGGVLLAEDGHTRLAPGEDTEVLRWPVNSGDIAEVPYVTLSEQEDALEISLPSGEKQAWRGGGMCPGWCDHPETFVERPPPEPCEPPYDE